MATTVAQLIATLGLDASDFNKGVDQVKTKGNSLGTAMAGLSAIGGGVLAAGFATAAAGAVILGKELSTDLSIAMESQKVQAQLQAVLKSTGGVAGVTADEANKLAESLMKVTTFDDEAIVSGESMLLTFTNIGQNVFPQATETILDMSQALGQDLQSSAIQLGKALQDPVAGVTALRRVGVNFSEAQQDMIKSMVQAGQVEEAQKFILKELQTEFGGSAKAAGKTFGGQMTILKNTIDNVRESVGARLIPILQKLLERFLEIYNSPAFQEFLNKAIDSIIAFIEVVADNVPKIIEGFGKFIAWLQENKPVVVGILVALGAAVVAFGVTTAVSIATAIAPLLPVIAILVAVGVAAGILYKVWSEHWDAIQEKTSGFFTWLKAAWDAIWKVLYPIVQYFLAQIKTAVEAWHALMSGDFYTFGQKLREIWDRAWSFLASIVANILANMIANARSFISNLIANFQNISLADIGRNLIMGLWNGMNDMKNWIMDKIRGFINAILNTFKGFFGIHSPSKLMENMIGKNMALGMNIGFQNNLQLEPSAALSKLSMGANVSSLTRNEPAPGTQSGNQFDEYRLARIMSQELQKVFAGR